MNLRVLVFLISVWIFVWLRFEGIFVLILSCSFILLSGMMVSCLMMVFMIWCMFCVGLLVDIIIVLVNWVGFFFVVVGFDVLLVVWVLLVFFVVLVVLLGLWVGLGSVGDGWCVFVMFGFMMMLLLLMIIMVFLVCEIVRFR